MQHFIGDVLDNAIGDTFVHGRRERTHIQCQDCHDPVVSASPNDPSRIIRSVSKTDNRYSVNRIVIKVDSIR